MLGFFKRLLKRAIAESYNLLPRSLTKAIFKTSPKVLMYHRVIPEELSEEESSFMLEPGMFVRPEAFERQLVFLKKNYEIVFLSELVSELQANPGSNKNLVALTFDDAWYDNLKYAAPLLIKHNIPSTIFVPTSYIEGNKLFWTDEIAVALKSCPLKLKEILESNDFNLDEISFKESPDSLFKIINLLKKTSFEKREKLIAELQPNLKKISSQFMNWEELKSLPKEFFKFGSHTHSHHFSDELSDGEFKEDIEKSLELLKSNFSKEQISKSFCYPSGRYKKSNQEVLSGFDFFNASLLVTGEYSLEQVPPLIGRIGIHQDISYSEAMFKFRLEVQG